MQHPRREEARDGLLVGAGHGLDVVDEPAVTAGRALSHVVVHDGRGVCLQLALSIVGSLSISPM